MVRYATIRLLDVIVCTSMKIYKRKHQAGWGRRKRRRQAGWGSRRRRSYRRRNGRFRRQRGRGPKWDKFKTGVNDIASRAWSKIAPSMVSAGKRSIPRVAGILMSRGNAAHKKTAFKGLAKKFGKDVFTDVMKNVMK